MRRLIYRLLPVLLPLAIALVRSVWTKVADSRHPRRSTHRRSIRR